MKLNVQRVIELCVEEGINDALMNHREEDRLAEKISEYIWNNLDYYFDFEDN